MAFCETDRLRLRQMQAEDADFLFSLLSDAETTAFLPLFPSAPARTPKITSASAWRMAGFFSPCARRKRTSRPSAT